jgi:predicted peptidase
MAKWLGLLLLFVAGTAQADEAVRHEIAFVETPAQRDTLARFAAAPTWEFAVGNYKSLPYRFFTPQSRGPWPLVVILHGSGAMGDDNRAQLGPFAKAWREPDIARRFPAYIVVPQVAQRSADYTADTDGLPASHAGASLSRVLELVDELAARYAVDRSRIYVVGFSMGGSAALDALLVAPQRFAAAVAFSPVPPERRYAPALADVPILLVHGSADTDNPYDASVAWAQASSNSLNFRVYTGMDHRVPPEMMLATDWRDWLFAQRLKR